MNELEWERALEDAHYVLPLLAGDAWILERLVRDAAASDWHGCGDAFVRIVDRLAAAPMWQPRKARTSP